MFYAKSKERDKFNVLFLDGSPHDCQQRFALYVSLLPESRGDVIQILIMEARMANKLPYAEGKLVDETGECVGVKISRCRNS